MKASCTLAEAERQTRAAGELEELPTKRIAKFGSTIATCVLIAAAAAPGTAMAKPDKPENAAQTDSGTGCLVRDANGAYHFDASCEQHTTIKRDKNGAITMFNYHDKGQLPDGAPRPSSAQINNAPWPGCPDGIKEVTSPSGEYRSDCRYGK